MQKMKLKAYLAKLNIGRHLMKSQPRPEAALINAASVEDKDSPYVKGRMAWNELYGSTVTQLENSYRLTACVCVIAIGLAALVWHIASQAQIKPYIVQVSSNGQVITGDQAQSFDTSNIPQIVIQGALYSFLSNARGVTGDPDVDQNNIYAAQAVTTGSAFTTLSNYYQANNPLILGKTEKVTIQNVYLIPRTPTTYEIDWQENTTSLDDQPISSSNYVADITYKLGDIKDVRYNPLGIYITDLTWTKQI